MSEVKEAAIGLAVVVLAPIWIPVMLGLTAFEGLRWLGCQVLDGMESHKRKREREEAQAARDKAA